MAWLNSELAKVQVWFLFWMCPLHKAVSAVTEPWGRLTNWVRWPGCAWTWTHRLCLHEMHLLSNLNRQTRTWTCYRSSSLTFSLVNTVYYGTYGTTVNIYKNILVTCYRKSRGNQFFSWIILTNNAPIQSRCLGATKISRLPRNSLNPFFLTHASAIKH